MITKVGKILGSGSDSIVYEDPEDKTKIIKLCKKNNIQSLLDIFIKNNIKHENLMFSNTIEYERGKLIYREIKYNVISAPYLSDKSFDQRMKISLGLIKGIKFLHSLNILHGDIKPSNILVDDHLNAKVNDFSISRLADNPNPDKNMYTYLYKPPEVMLGEKIDIKADIYALGCTLYFIINSKTLFIKINEFKIPCFTGEDKDINKFIKIMIQRDVLKRPTIEEVYDFFITFFTPEKIKDEKENKDFNLVSLVLYFCNQNDLEEDKFLDNIRGIRKHDFTRLEIEKILFKFS
jgi:serine/threonine protein kinase